MSVPASALTSEKPNVLPAPLGSEPNLDRFDAMKEKIGDLLWLVEYRIEGGLYWNAHQEIKGLKELLGQFSREMPGRMSYYRDVLTKALDKIQENMTSILDAERRRDTLDRHAVEHRVRNLRSSINNFKYFLNTSIHSQDQSLSDEAKAFVRDSADREANAQMRKSYAAAAEHLDKMGCNLHRSIVRSLLASKPVDIAQQNQELQEAAASLWSLEPACERQVDEDKFIQLSQENHELRGKIKAGEYEEKLGRKMPCANASSYWFRRGSLTERLFKQRTCNDALKDFADRAEKK